MPLVILDSDKSGQDAKKKLLSGLYQGSPDQLIDIFDISGLSGSEIEDLIPVDLMQRPLDRLFRDVDDEDIIDFLKPDMPIVPQIEAFAEKHNVSLAKGWKVSLSKSVKQQLQKTNPGDISGEFILKWVALFNKFKNSTKQ